MTSLRLWFQMNLKLERYCSHLWASLWILTFFILNSVITYSHTFAQLNFLVYLVYCSNSTLQEPKLIKIKMRHVLLLKRFSSYRFLSFSNMMYYYSKGHFPKEVLQNFVYGSLWDCTVYTGFCCYTCKFPQTISAKTSHCLRSIKTQN